MEFLKFGNAPHFVEREEMVFDPVLGGWVSVAKRGPQYRQPPPPRWAVPDDKGDEPTASTHFEEPHFSNWRLNMNKEVELGVMPAEWSVSSAMDDPRPNGAAIFDARFIQSPVGRARAGRSMMWDPRGTAHAGGTQKASNIDSASWADNWSDETAAAKALMEERGDAFGSG